MKIRVTGCPTKHQLRHIRKFGRFFAKKFFTPQTSKKILLHIEVLERKSAMQDIGQMFEMDGTKRFPHQHRICLRPEKSEHLKGFIKALAHEMVHVKQVVKGEMKGLDHRTIFLNKKVNEDKVHYYDLPWEIEAHGREYGLWNQYRSYLESKKVDKTKSRRKRTLHKGTVPENCGAGGESSTGTSHDSGREELVLPETRISWHGQELSGHEVDSRQFDLFSE